MTAAAALQYNSFLTPTHASPATPASRGAATTKTPKAGHPQSLTSSSQERAVSSPPSATCFQRKMSAAVATAEDAEHELLEGRPRLVFKSSPSSMKVGPAVDKMTDVVGNSLQQKYVSFVNTPEPLRVGWSEPIAEAFNVRGATYLEDGIKKPSKSSVFQILTSDLIQVEKPVLTGICNHPAERVQQALRREEQGHGTQLPAFLFVINYCIPNSGGAHFHWVAYFGVEDVSVLRDASTPLGRLCEPFFFGKDNDDFCDETFKLIPRIVEGNFVVKKAVGSKPALLGRKLKQHYIRSDRFFELIVEIGSDPVADKVVKIAGGTAAKSMVVDMMFLLEGKQDNVTLPERILGGCRIERLDFKNKDLQRPLNN